MRKDDASMALAWVAKVCDTDMASRMIKAIYPYSYKGWTECLPVKPDNSQAL